MRIAVLSVLSVAGSMLILSACAFPLMSTRHFFARVDLERAVEHLLRKQGGEIVFAVDCPDSLEIRTGARTHCLVQNGDGAKVDVAVVVTDAAGGRGRIAVQVKIGH